VTPNVLVATGAVSCYPVSMVNLIWFADEKMFIVLALSNMGAEVRCLSSQKLNHFSNSVCWCIFLLEHTKDQLSYRYVNVMALHVFCGCICKTSWICHQQTRL